MSRCHVRSRAERTPRRRGLCASTLPPRARGARAPAHRHQPITQPGKKKKRKEKLARRRPGRSSESKLEQARRPPRNQRASGWRWLPAAGRRRAGQPRAGCRAAEPAPAALVLCDDRWGGGRRRAHRTVGVHLKFGCPQAHRGPGDGVHQLVPAARQSVVRCMHPATGSAPRETNCWTARAQMV